MLRNRTRWPSKRFHFRFNLNREKKNKNVSQRNWQRLRKVTRCSEMQTLWRGPVIVPWQGVLERLKSFVGRFNQRGVLTKNIIKKLVKKFTTAWMNGLDKTFPNMRCRSLNNCLRHLCAWKCWLPGSQWWWWPPFFPNQRYFFSFLVHLPSLQ